MFDYNSRHIGLRMLTYMKFIIYIDTTTFYNAPCWSKLLCVSLTAWSALDVRHCWRGPMYAGGTRWPLVSALPHASLPPWGLRQ